MKTILVYSGGLDSTTLLYKLLAEGKEVKAISFNYGQRHDIELRKASETCSKLGIEHKIVNLEFMRDICSNSALTGDMEVPEGNYDDENMKITFVPNRNMIMASIAIGWAVNLGFDQVAIGVHSGDHAIYPDCRPDFIDRLHQTALFANEQAISIYAPFLHLDKGDIVKEGKELNVDYSLTWTCYKGEEKPCGKCGSCVERAEAFAKAGLKDPLIEKSYEN